MNYRPTLGWIYVDIPQYSPIIYETIDGVYYRRYFWNMTHRPSWVHSNLTAIIIYETATNHRAKIEAFFAKSFKMKYLEPI